MKWWQWFKFTLASLVLLFTLAVMSLAYHLWIEPLDVVLQLKSFSKQKMTRFWSKEQVPVEAKKITPSSQPINISKDVEGFNVLREQIVLGQIQQARQGLKLWIQEFPNSQLLSQAKTILGEMNMDELFSSQNPRVQTIEIQKGDVLLKLIEQRQSNVTHFCFINQIQSFPRVRPGDHFLLMPLNFSIKIHLASKRIDLMEQDEWVKSYPIIKMGSINRDVKELGVVSIHGILNQKKVLDYQADYRKSQKLLMGENQIMITEHQASLHTEKSNTMYLNVLDLNELLMFMRDGSKIILND